MLRTSHDANLLYKCLIRPRRPELPRNIRERFLPEFEGIAIPTAPASRRTFLKAYERFASRRMNSRLATLRRLQSLNAPETIVDQDVEKIIEKIRLLSKINTLSLRSGKPNRYIELLIDSVKQQEVFFDSIDVFENRHRIEFHDTSETARRATEQLVDLVKKQTADAIRKFVAVMAEMPRKNSAKGREEDNEILVTAIETALLFWPVELVAEALDPDQLHIIESTCGSKITEVAEFEKALLKRNGTKELPQEGICVCQYEQTTHLLAYGQWFEIGELHGYVTDRQMFEQPHLRGITFDRTILVRPGEEATIQHELQHVFDNVSGISSVLDPTTCEYHAELAKIAFSDGPFIRLRMIDDILWSAVMGSENASRYYEARLRIIKQMKGFKNKKNRATQLLNESYKRACGLTYDEILAPFVNR